MFPVYKVYWSSFKSFKGSRFASSCLRLLLSANVQNPHIYGWGSLLFTWFITSMFQTHTHTHTLISEHNFLSVRIVSMTMRRSECINASPDKQWSFTKTRGSLRQLVKSMLRVSSLIKASPLRPDTVSIPAGPWRHAPMIGLKCLSVRQLSWTNDSLCCLLDWHDNLILWARQGKSDLGAFYWGWGKLTRADKSLPWAINRIKEQQQRQTLLPPSVFF